MNRIAQADKMFRNKFAWTSTLSYFSAFYIDVYDKHLPLKTFDMGEVIAKFGFDLYNSCYKTIISLIEIIPFLKGSLPNPTHLILDLQPVTRKLATIVKTGIKELGIFSVSLRTFYAEAISDNKKIEIKKLLDEEIFNFS